MNALSSECSKNLRRAGPGSGGQGESSPVISSQTGVHPRLEQVVRKHLGAPWRQPMHPPTVKAFEAVEEFIAERGQAGLILDSGCGTGSSTKKLAQRFPASLVIGVDQSNYRLSKQEGPQQSLRAGNVLLVRAELESLWRLALAAGWRLDRHYLLYPNPWPKPAHLLRRWHAHPVFPALLALGGVLEMRCNWEIYAGEFSAGLKLATGLDAPPRALDPETPLSEFEAKYRASGHDLFSVKVDLGESESAVGSEP